MHSSAFTHSAVSLGEKLAYIHAGSISFGSCSAGDKDKNHEQLDQRDARDEARSHASCTQARIRSPKSEMNA
jgi:hypothetical protein